MDPKARSEHIQQTLRRCAAELHYSGLLRHLAAEMGLHQGVFSYWFRKGRVPKIRAEWLERRFPGIAVAATLVGKRKGPAKKASKGAAK